MISEWRVQSKNKAREAGHVIGDKEHKFEITCNFPPDSVSIDVWKELCLGWNTEKWLKKSESGRENRTRNENNDRISRHTGGSMGFDERRINLEKKIRRKVTWIEIFFDTHLTKEHKAKFWDGELEIDNLDGSEFCTERSKEVYVAYKKRMIELHGSDLTQHPDDPDVWASVQASLGIGSRGRIFGIGSSDAHFMVTGKPSTSSKARLYLDGLKSQEKDQEVWVELENERKARQELEDQLQQIQNELKKKEELEERRQNEYKENEERRHKYFEEMMRKFPPPGN